jgi:hypothetical protein
MSVSNTVANNDTKKRANCPALVYPKFNVARLTVPIQKNKTIGVMPLIKKPLITYRYNLFSRTEPAVPVVFDRLLIRR